ncbi:DUF5399 family protein [Simkania sp.]|uniref:DUF5399 family protein n=1 Tax=Simkania sp. TaxID=34094 RepID=UPI003B526454
MAEPRTIDNLGVETSVRWATDQELLDKSIIHEAPRISQQTVVDVHAPFYTSEFDLIFQTKQRHQQWAAFFAPPGYTTQKMRIFTYQIIPSLGTEEFQQAQMQKIKERCDLNKMKRKENKSADQAAGYAWEDERDEEEEQKESKTLLDLLEYIHGLDSLLSAINARRSQYSKG